ncbi:hypothetical protein [Leifsonia sp. Root112D2]|uniref:hypothetical protein n=1 Tax=Leifsonia sp. Root112D2 TaxID=1736426 RepID=UPI0006F1C3D6|nr:hypothetical protein [Leifsonia sp. Root112D2]KQV08155.1 hypothetical protein ASC63_13545 [Leifsonia sp. Root112D2]
MTTREEIDAFKQHRLWALTAQTIRGLGDAKGRSSTDRETIARTLAITKYVNGCRSIEAYLFPADREAQANNIAGQVDVIASQLAGWDQDAAMLPPTVASLDSASDQILAYITQYTWPTVLGRSANVRVLAEIAESYREAAEQSLQAVEDGAATVQGRFTEIEAEASALIAEAETRGKEAAASLASIAETQAAQAENAQGQLQQVLKKVQGAAEGAQTDIRAVAENDREHMKAEAENLLAGLRENHETGNELVRKVADQSVGGGYLEFAKSEKMASTRWNVIGIVAVVAAFIYLALVFWSQQATTVESSILKLGISLSVVGFSAYAFREGGKRQRQSLEARYRALDVLAMPPFSKDLTEEQQQRLRFIMGERLFASSAERALSGKSHVRDTATPGIAGFDEATIASAIELVRAAAKPST